MWRVCPTCGDKQPCAIGGSVDPDAASKRGKVTYAVTCATCGHEYANPSTMDAALAEAAKLAQYKRDHA